MKRLLFLLICAALVGGCSNEGSVQFCEGYSPEYEGVTCGKKFETGTMSAVITGKDPFQKNKLDVKIYELRGKDETEIDTVAVKVDPLKSKAAASISLLLEGKYRVKAFAGDSEIASGEVEIIDYE
jgi:hypothetical protein